MIWSESCIEINVQLISIFPSQGAYWAFCCCPKIFGVFWLPNKGFRRRFRSIFSKLILVISNCGIMLKMCLSCACFLISHQTTLNVCSCNIHLKQLHSRISTKTFAGFFPFFRRSHPQPQAQTSALGIWCKHVRSPGQFHPLGNERESFRDNKTTTHTDTHTKNFVLTTLMLECFCAWGALKGRQRLQLKPKKRV